MSEALRRDRPDFVLVTRPRPTGAERFAAMSKAEQDATLGPELAAAIRAGKVTIAELEHRDRFGRVTPEPNEDVL